MSWIPCRVCGTHRSSTVVSSDGVHVFDCSGCGEPGYIEPWPEWDERSAGFAEWLVRKPHEN